MISRSLVAAFLCLLALLSGPAVADEDEHRAETEHHAGKPGASYEAPLPPELSTSPDLCAHAPCEDVFPEADRFSERKGRPSYVEAYHDEHGKQELLGYVFLSTDIVDIPAYSGKPVVTLIGLLFAVVAWFFKGNWFRGGKRIMSEQEERRYRAKLGK